MTSDTPTIYVEVRQRLQREIAEALPLRLIDCQIYTDHLASLGAREISRTHFQRTLEVALARPATALGALPRCRADALRWAA